MFRRRNREQAGENSKMDRFKKYIDRGYLVTRKTYTPMIGPHGEPLIDMALSKENEGSVVFGFTPEEAKEAEQYIDAGKAKGSE